MSFPHTPRTPVQESRAILLVDRLLLVGQNIHVSDSTDCKYRIEIQPKSYKRNVLPGSIHEFHPSGNNIPGRLGSIFQELWQH